jgi:hypothetical protein
MIKLQFIFLFQYFLKCPNSNEVGKSSKSQKKKKLVTNSKFSLSKRSKR